MIARKRLLYPTTRMQSCKLLGLICAACLVIVFLETLGGLAVPVEFVGTIKSGKAAVEADLRNKERSSLRHSSSATDDDDDDDEPPVLRSLTDPTRITRVYRTLNDLNDLANLFFENGRMCWSLWGSDSTQYELLATQRSTMVDITYNAHQLFHDMAVHGTGNFLLIFYAIRAIARVTGHVDVLLQATDAQQRQSSLVLPWLMGIFPSLDADQLAANQQVGTVDDVCNYKLPGPMRTAVVFGWILPEIRFELRRMAVAMVGIPSQDHPSALWAQENLYSKPHLAHRHGRNYMQLPHPKKGQVPFYPDTVLDDAVVHFRCGDLVNTDRFEVMGFMKFGSFSRHISPAARRIGIVTQPFDDDAQVRKAELDTVIKDRCQVLVTAFVQHLRQKFPAATVSVHNSRNETITLTLARMVMANQTVIGLTSFAIFPALTTFGTGYIQHNEGDLHDWLTTSPTAQRLENVTLIREPMLIPAEFKKLWGENGEGALAWFQEDPPSTTIAA